MFKVGQKVVCKKLDGTIDGSAPRGIKIGKIYTIEFISTCACGKQLLHLKGVPLSNRYCGFKKNFTPTGLHNGYYSFRFERLIDDFAENMLNGILEEVNKRI